MNRLIMTPATGERLLRFVGDRVHFSLRTEDGAPLPEGWRVLLRTTLGRAKSLRQEIIASYPRRPTLANAAWHDVPMTPCGNEWTRDLTLAETGFFRAKAYAVDPEGRQHWPDGEDVGVSMHPDQYRTGNTIYCAFIRMFGETKHAKDTAEPCARSSTGGPGQARLHRHSLLGKIPRLNQGTAFHHRHARLPHPAPAAGQSHAHVFARFGRFGSPYASQDLTAIDPALVEFDQRTTGIDQFRELTYATHARGGRVFIDIVINHTGWGARLQEMHPEWYLRDGQGNFVSPGAWGTVWEDLAELDHRNPSLWDELAEMFLIWCRRGVDGFRCDAGYKVPLPAWRYITARVLEEFPETIFLLEGLGGSWEATEALITDGGMQWAYSELFQNYSGVEIASYLEYALRQSERLGLYVHYSETHDNTRLAARGREWSLLRNRLCGLTSPCGGFGFTSGVEWLATERINVHQSRGLSWGSSPNIVRELGQLNELLRTHPCFFDGAKLTRISMPESTVYALLRESADQTHRVLVVVNTDLERNQIAQFQPSLFCADDVAPVSFDPSLLSDLLGQTLTLSQRSLDGAVVIEIPPAACLCLSLVTKHAAAIQRETLLSSTCQPAAAFRVADVPPVLYARARAQAAWGVTALSRVMPAEAIGAFDWRVLADWVNRDPKLFLGAVADLERNSVSTDLLSGLFDSIERKRFPKVVTWELIHRTRITLIPADHWLLLHDPAPFRATLSVPGAPLEHVQSIAVQSGHVAFFAPGPAGSHHDSTLQLERYAEKDQRVEATLRFLTSDTDSQAAAVSVKHPTVALLTNGRGGMARLGVDFGNITSKYDCLLGANLHPHLPVDRHVLAKRARLWLVADGFVTPLTLENLKLFEAGTTARWTFLASAGDGRAVEIEVDAEMIPLQNATLLRFHRPARVPAFGKNLSPETRVSLTVRIDLEDRNFHAETHYNGAADHHFHSNTHTLPEGNGFQFTPAPDRRLHVQVSAGRYHPHVEWCVNVPHPIEATRGQPASGDAYSPGWFEVPLHAGDTATLLATAEWNGEATQIPTPQFSLEAQAIQADPFYESLLRAVKAFVVRRGEGKTVIAGYPWFLDWGRDSLICARGLIAGGLLEDVRDLLMTFARFEENGTLPNTIHGENATNRDTTDAPLWFGVACEELAAQLPGFRETLVDGRRTIADVLRSIATNYMRGTPNGIHMDADSGLVWSPSHFTWMDTNYPAGTPREGYPIEIQTLWICLLKQLGALGGPALGNSWSELAAKAEASLQELFWIEERGWFADVLEAKSGVSAKMAGRGDALRSNCLFPVSLGLITGERARRTVDAAMRYLVVPGACRSLAPLRVTPPHPIYGNDGGLLNDPAFPYWARYEGDEDTRRKAAYHNGTAWGWTFPPFCEALARAWDFDPSAVAAAKTYLCSMRELMRTGCAGHVAEIFDGDAPHQARGCDAQAWSVTEALRVWTFLRGRSK